MFSSTFRIAAYSICLSFLTLQGRPCIASTVDKGLLGEYPLLEDGSDLSGNHRDIIAPAPVGFAATGPVAGAELSRAGAILSFSGYKPYIGPPPEAFYQSAFEAGSTGYTVSGWLFVKSFTAPSVGGAAPVNLAEYPSGLAFAGFWVTRQSHQIVFIMNSARLSLVGPDPVQDAGPIFGVTSNATIEAHQWVHVAITVDLASKSYALYINGRSDRKGTIDFLTAPYLKNIYLLSPTIPESTARAAMTDKSASSILNGTVRDITIHNRALSPEEVADLASPDPDIVAQHAPLIYLHPDERFMPSSLEFFAQNVHLECDGARVNKDVVPLPGSSRPVLQAADFPSWQAQTKPDSNDSRCALTTNQPMKGPYTILPFFAGQKPTAVSPVPVYVFTYDISSRTSFTAQYTTFYPYNQGKMGCPLFAPADNCLSPSGRKEFDDHVADWELMSIRYVGGEPVEVHVGAHGNDEPEMATTYVPKTAPDGSISWASRPNDNGSGASDAEVSGWLLEVFKFFKGATQNTGGELQWQGGHPIVYSASGSHGLWATAGKHVYKLVLGDQLTDHTAAGTPWETWRSLAVANEPRYHAMLFDYKGDWGNGHAGKSVCDYILDVVAGPGGRTLLATVLGITGAFNGNPCNILQDAAGYYSDDYAKKVESVNHLYQLNGGPQLDPQRDRKYLMVPLYGNN